MKFQPPFPPQDTFPMALGHFIPFPTGKTTVSSTLRPPQSPPLPAPHTTSQGRACCLSFLARLWGMGLLCMSEPLKAQPSDVLIFVLTFPALGALAWLEKVIPSHRAGAEAVTLSGSPLLGFPWVCPTHLAPCSKFPSLFADSFLYSLCTLPTVSTDPLAQLTNPIPSLCFAYKLLRWKA